MEPQEPLVVEEPAATVEPTPEPKPVETPDRAAMFREAFATEADDPELDAVTPTADQIAAMPPHLRALGRAFYRDTAATHAKALADLETRQKAWEAEKAAALARHEADTRSLRQREAAILRLADAPTAKDPGDEPDVDVFTPEGLKAFTDWKVRQQLAAAQAAERAPIREVRAQAREQADRENLEARHPELKDAKVWDALGAHLEKLNEGIDPEMVAKGQARWRYDYNQGAEHFFNQREIAALRAAEAARATAEATDRAQAARAIGRTTAAGGPNLLARYDALYRQDKDAARDLLIDNPDVRAAVLARNGVSP